MLFDSHSPSPTLSTSCSAGAGRQAGVGVSDTCNSAAIPCLCGQPGHRQHSRKWGESRPVQPQRRTRSPKKAPRMMVPTYTLFLFTNVCSSTPGAAGRASAARRQGGSERAPGWQRQRAPPPPRARPCGGWLRVRARPVRSLDQRCRRWGRRCRTGLHPAESGRAEAQRAAAAQPQLRAASGSTSHVVKHVPEAHRAAVCCTGCWVWAASFLGCWTAGSGPGGDRDTSLRPGRGLFGEARPAPRPAPRPSTRCPP